MHDLLKLYETPADLKKEHQAGDKVHIESGPFSGIDAVFQMSKSSDRVQVLIQVLGAERPINVHKDDISAADCFSSAHVGPTGLLDQ